jgi:hypothetical protein
MVGAERSGVLPLRVGYAIAFTDRDPAVFASGNSRTLIRFSKPGNNTGRFKPMAFACFVDYAQNRACFRSGEVRIFDSTGNVERVIPFDDANRKL